MKRILTLLSAVLLTVLSGNVYAQKNNTANDYNLKKAYEVLNEEKNEAKALDLVNKQLRETPDNVDARILRVRLLRRKQEFGQALQDINYALKVNKPKKTKVAMSTLRWWKAFIYQDMRDKDNAVVSFKTAYELFECKDVQMAAKKKLSGDYETIKKAIFEKYVANSKGHAKGIGQLANVIVEKLPSILREVDKSAPNSVIFVYPVIVYFDDCFDVEGPNYLLNKEFQRIISEKNVTADYEVKDVVMVNIEQLMRLENFFAAEKLDLAYLINSYIEYKEEFELNQVFPFNKYIFQEARKVGYELKKTRWFDEVFENLKIMDRKGL